MTNLEALQAVVDIDQISAASFEKAVIDAGLLPTDNYVIASKDLLNAAGVAVLNGWIASSMSEGGYSISFDRKAIDAKIQALNGVSGARGIKNISNIW